MKVEDYLETYYQTYLFHKQILSVEFERMGAKTTVCLLILKNRFEVIGTSACVDPKDFDPEIGRKYAFLNALSKVEEIEGVLRQQEIWEEKTK